MKCLHCGNMFKEHEFCPNCGFYRSDRVYNFLTANATDALLIDFVTAVDPPKLAALRARLANSLIRAVDLVWGMIETDRKNFDLLIALIPYYVGASWKRWAADSATVPEELAQNQAFPAHAWNLGISPHNIFQVLTDSFSASELRRFTFEETSFNSVYHQLAEGTGKAEIIHRIIAFATNDPSTGYPRLKALFEFIAEENTAQWRRYQSLLEHHNLVHREK
jgi:hypothetical protein